MNVPASVQIVKPELPPIGKFLYIYRGGEWDVISSEPDEFDKIIANNPNKEFRILTPTAPREPMSGEDLDRFERMYFDKADASVADIIRAVEAHHGIGREDGK